MSVICVFYSPTLLSRRNSVKPNNTGRLERHHGANRDIGISVCGVVGSNRQTAALASVIILLIKHFVWRRSRCRYRCRCRRGLPKFPTIPPATAVVCLRWLKTVSSTFQDLDFDVSLEPLFTNWYYNHGTKTLPNHWWTRCYYFRDTINRLPQQQYDLLKTPLSSALSAFRITEF